MSSKIVYIRVSLLYYRPTKWQIRIYEYINYTYTRNYDYKLLGKSYYYDNIAATRIKIKRLYVLLLHTRTAHVLTYVQVGLDDEYKLSFTSYQLPATSYHNHVFG